MALRQCLLIPWKPSEIYSEKKGVWLASLHSHSCWVYPRLFQNSCFLVVPKYPRCLVCYFEHWQMCVNIWFFLLPSNHLSVTSHFPPLFFFPTLSFFLWGLLPLLVISGTDLPSALALIAQLCSRLKGGGGERCLRLFFFPQMDRLLLY